jgi:hypothetical protein
MCKEHEVLSSLLTLLMVRPAARRLRRHKGDRVSGSEQTEGGEGDAIVQIRVPKSLRNEIARIALEQGGMTFRALILSALKATYGLDVADDELRDRRGRQAGEGHQ